MRARAILAVCALVVAGACTAKTTDPPAGTPTARTTTTTTTDPVDRAAVDRLIDRIAPAFKPVLKAESGEVGPKDLNQSATDLASLADELKDPTKRPAAVPGNTVDDLVAALATTGTATTQLARNLGSCPAGISTPRCTELYQALNQGQTALSTALLGFAGFGTRPPDAVQNLLYT